MASMFKVSVIPDTNVLLSDLELVKALYSNDIPMTYTVNFARTVIEELDNLKTKKAEARNAIRFIESVAGLIKTEIEGRVDDRKIDVIVTAREEVVVKNNDDKILNYTFQLENPILLTKDRAFYIKCQSFNIKAILVEDADGKGIIYTILNEFGISGEVEQKRMKQKYLNDVKQTLKEIIGPVIVEIVRKELGNASIPPNSTIEFYLGFVNKNFSVFRNFLPKRAVKVIGEFLKHLKDENVEMVMKMAHPLCMLFRKVFPPSII